MALRDTLAVLAGEFNRARPERGFLADPGWLPAWLALQPGRVRALAARESADWEGDPRFRQLVAYCLIRCGDDWLAYRRAKGGERRLNGKLSLGFAGHAEERDLEAGGLPTLAVATAARELEEEVEIHPPGPLPYPVGLLADDSDPVGRCHLGLTLVLDLPRGAQVRGATPAVEVIGWMPPGLLLREVGRYERWSRILIDAIAAGVFDRPGVRSPGT